MQSYALVARQQPPANENENENDFWSSVPVAIARLTSIAKAVRHSTFVTYLYDAAAPIVSFAARATYNAVISAYRGYTHIGSLFSFFRDKEFSKKTRALLRRMIWQTAKYVSIPFFYYSAVQPKLTESDWLPVANYIAYFIMSMTFVRRLIDYSITASLIPRAIEHDVNFVHITLFFRDLFDRLAILYARYLAHKNANEFFRKNFYDRLSKVVERVDLRRWYAKSVANDFEREVYEALLVILDHDSSKVGSSLAKKLAPELSKTIFTALDIVLNKKTIEGNIRVMLMQSGSSLAEVFGLLLDDGLKVAKGTVDEIAGAVEKMQANLPVEPYTPSVMNTSQKIRSIMQGPLYFAFSSYAVEFFVNLIFPFFASEKMVWTTAFVLRSILYGQALAEYQLVANGISAPDRYQFFQSRNFVCLGMGASQLAWIVVATEGLKYFYGVNSFFIVDAITQLVLNLHLAALYLNKKALPEEVVKFDPSRRLRAVADRVLNRVLARFEPKVKRLDDAEGRQKLISRGASIITSRFLIWFVAIGLTDSRWKYLSSNALEMRQVNLLTIATKIPAVRLLLREYAPDLVGVVEQVNYAYDAYLPVASYVVWLSSVVLSVQVGGNNTLAGVLFTAAKFSTVSSVVFLTQVLQQEGLGAVLEDFERKLKNMTKKPESLMERPLISIIKKEQEEVEEKKRTNIQSPQQALEEAVAEAVSTDLPSSTQAVNRNGMSTVNLLRHMTTNQQILQLSHGDEKRQVEEKKEEGDEDGWEKVTRNEIGTDAATVLAKRVESAKVQQEKDDDFQAWLRTPTSTVLPARSVASQFKSTMRGLFRGASQVNAPSSSVRLTS